jgi:hypothetical protein
MRFARRGYERRLPGLRQHLAPLVSGRYLLTASREAVDAARGRRGLKVLFEPGIGG